jgi:hypothetical protein
VRNGEVASAGSEPAEPLKRFKLPRGKLATAPHSLTLLGALKPEALVGPKYQLDRRSTRRSQCRASPKNLGDATSAPPEVANKVGGAPTSTD